MKTIIIHDRMDNNVEIKITLHNKREQTLMRIILQNADRAVVYFEKKEQIAYRAIEEISNMLSAMYFMDCLSTSFSIVSIEQVKDLLADCNGQFFW